MKLTSAHLLLTGAVELCGALPHYDSPQQRLAKGLSLTGKYAKDNPYTPDHSDPHDHAIDAIGKGLDPRPWRNGDGATVLGPYNRDRSRQSPDMIRPPSTDHGNIPNMRWSYTDSHVRIEVRCNLSRHHHHPPSLVLTNPVWAVGGRMDKANHDS